MKILSNTFMLVMSHEDFFKNNIDKIYDPHCKKGFVYILKGDETPEIFNLKLSEAEREIEYWKGLSAHRLKGLLYWKAMHDKVSNKLTLNDVFKQMFVTKSVLINKIKKDYKFHGSRMEIPFETKFKGDKK